MEQIIILIVILSGATAQPKNLAVGAFIIFLRFAGFLGKLGMTYMVGANQNPNAHTPSSHVIQNEAKQKHGIPQTEEKDKSLCHSERSDSAALRI